MALTGLADGKWRCCLSQEDKYIHLMLTGSTCGVGSNGCWFAASRSHAVAGADLDESQPQAQSLPKPNFMRGLQDRRYVRGLFCVYVYIFIYLHIHIYVYVCVCMYICNMCTCMYVHRHIHTCVCV